MTDANGKNVLIIGATGMVGSEALKHALADPAVAAVTTLGRRKTGVEHAKLREIEHADFESLEPVSNAFEGQDALLFCLGAYTGSLPDDQFRKVTVDYAVNTGEALLAGSPDAAYCLLSGQGADQTEKARASFARFKGAAEKALLALGLGSVHIFRPGYIYPVTPRKEPNFGYTVFRWLWPVLRGLSSNLGISSADLAWAMLHGGLHGTGEHTEPVLENRDIRAFVATHG